MYFKLERKEKNRETLFTFNFQASFDVTKFHEFFLAKFEAIHACLLRPSATPEDLANGSLINQKNLRTHNFEGMAEELEMGFREV